MRQSILSILITIRVKKFFFFFFSNGVSIGSTQIYHRSFKTIEYYIEIMKFRDPRDSLEIVPFEGEKNETAKEKEGRKKG